MGAYQASIDSAFGESFAAGCRQRIEQATQHPNGRGIGHARLTIDLNAAEHGTAAFEQIDEERVIG